VNATGQTAALPESIEATPKWLDAHEMLLRKAMRAAAATPLWCGPRNTDVYRVILIPSSRPLIVAEVRLGDDTSHVVTFVDPRTAEENRTLKRFESVAEAHNGNVDATMASAVETEATPFWTMPAFRDNADAMDGYIWIIEARRQGTYRMVIRDNVRDTPFEALVISILRAAHVTIDEDTIGDYVRPAESPR